VGFTGLETAIGAYAYAVPGLPLAQFVKMLSTNPARILSVPGGSLAPGSPGDITIFADREWTVDVSRFHSKGKSTPFAGMTLPRQAIATIVEGKLVMQEGRIFSQVRT
jgi:dihydroorotase